MKPSIRLAVLILFVLILDQSLKIWVKTHMEYGQEFKIFGVDWAIIHFVENPGMAFGITFGGAYGKLILSLFRITAVGFLILFLRQLIREGASFGILAGFGLILAGALGNILDSAFYGMLFSDSPYYGGVAEFFPPEGGYSKFLHGKVVDMLYFPLIRGEWPQWLPFLGGNHFMFFKPVFNIADLSITLGVLNILLFQRQFFQKRATTSPVEEEQAHTAQEDSPALPEQDLQD